MLGTQFLGNEAADNVQLVGARHCHHQVRGADTCLQQNLNGGAAALLTEDIQHPVGIAQRVGIFVDKDQVMIFTVPAQLLGQGISHLTVAYDDDLHMLSLCSL